MIWVLVVVIHLNLFGAGTTTTIPVGEFATLSECMSAAKTLADLRSGPGVNPPDSFAAICQREREA